MSRKENLKKVTHFMMIILAIELLACIPIMLPTKHGKSWFAKTIRDNGFPEKHKKIMRDYKAGTNLVDPKTLEPYYLKPVSGTGKVIITFLCFGFDLEFRARGESDCFSYMKRFGRMFFTCVLIVSVVNGWWHDVLEVFHQIPQHLDISGDRSKYVRYCLVPIVVVTSPNYPAALAMWGMLGVSSPAALLKLRPTYITFPGLSYLGFPLCLCMVSWLPALKYIYAILLLPYALFQIVVQLITYMALFFIFLLLLLSVSTLNFELICALLYMIGIIAGTFYLITFALKLYGWIIGAPSDSASYNFSAQRCADAFNLFHPSACSLTKEVKESLEGFNTEMLSSDFGGNLPVESEENLTERDGANEEEEEAVERLPKIVQWLVEDQPPIASLLEVQVEIVGKALAFLVPIVIQQAAVIMVVRYVLFDRPITGPSFKTRGSREIVFLIVDTVNERHFGTYVSTFIKAFLDFFTRRDCTESLSPPMCASGYSLAQQLAFRVWRVL